MKLIIDRFEEDYAVALVEDKPVNIPRLLLPGAKEGDMVDITVLGREKQPGTDEPGRIFARLRRKSSSAVSRIRHTTVIKPVKPSHPYKG